MNKVASGVTVAVYHGILYRINRIQSDLTMFDRGEILPMDFSSFDADLRAIREAQEFHKAHVKEFMTNKILAEKITRIAKLVDEYREKYGVGVSQR
ncbi:hypothetical protein [Numidum massiliense]|uniref:hypothetical protein n=1 Tax=Numidum massiliense TaxID=1522315 RepID=UPI0006D53F8C|nr:hypothetical protein [Numidum massiliense]